MRFRRLSEGEVLYLASKIKGAIICHTLKTTPREAEHEASKIFGDDILVVHADKFPGQKENEALVIVFEK